MRTHSPMVIHYVHDMDRAYSFYNETLGLAADTRSPGWTTLKCGTSSWPCTSSTRKLRKVRSHMQGSISRWMIWILRSRNLRQPVALFERFERQAVVYQCAWLRSVTRRAMASNCVSSSACLPPDDSLIGNEPGGFSCSCLRLTRRG